MKRILIITLVLFSLVGFSQESYKFKSGGRIMDENGVVLSPTYLRAKFGNNKEFLDLYNSGRTKKTVGNILLYTGITTVILKHLSYVSKANDRVVSNNPNTVKTPNAILYGVGAGLIVASIPIKIGFSRRIKKAVEVLNNGNSNATVGYFENTNFILSSDGIGFRISF